MIQNSREYKRKRLLDLKVDYQEEFFYDSKSDKLSQIEEQIRELENELNVPFAERTFKYYEDEPIHELEPAHFISVDLRYEHK